MEQNKEKIIYTSVYRNYTLGEFVLSNYFRLFKEDIENISMRRFDDDKRRKCLLLFQRVFDSMKTLVLGSSRRYEIDGDYSDDDSIEKLVELSKALSIKDTYEELYNTHPIDFLLEIDHSTSKSDLEFIEKIFKINVEVQINDDIQIK